MFEGKQKSTRLSVTRLLGEGGAIVASILLAFAIDAWWEEREIRIEEQQVLHSLHDEFLLIRKVVTGHLSDHLRDLKALENYMVAAQDGHAENAGPIIDAVILELLNPMTTDIGSGTLNALLGSGRIEILMNRTLRAKLAAWEGVIGEVWDDQELHAKDVHDLHMPYFIANNIPAGDAMHRWNEDWPLPPQSPSDDPELVARLLADEPLRNMVTMRYGYKMHTTDEFEIAIDAIDEIIREIEASFD